MSFHNVKFIIKEAILLVSWLHFCHIQMDNNTFLLKVNLRFFYSVRQNKLAQDNLILILFIVTLKKK